MTSTTSAKAVNAATQVITVSITRMVGSPMPGKSGTRYVEIVTHPRNIITRLRSCSKRNRALHGTGGGPSSAWNSALAAAAAEPSPVSATATKARRSIE